MVKPVVTLGSVARLGAFYALLCGALWLLQDRLIYQRAGERVGDWSIVDTTTWVTEVSFPSEDGTPLVGWYGRAASPSRGVVLYFHGNAENVATQAHELINFCQQLQFDCLIVDYRGYGKSRGVPSEAGLMMDARAAMRRLNSLSGSQPSEVVVFGRSLGGAAAAHVASQLGAKCLVLHSAFASMDDLAASKFWFVPTRRLLWNHLRTIDSVRDYHGPVFIAHGTRDTLVPFVHSERLFAASPSSTKTFLRQEGSTHFDAANREFYVELNRFLSLVDPH